MEACTRKPDAYPVFITYADCREDALLLAAMVRERFHVEIAHMNDMGPIIGGHAGPGTLALVFVSDEEKKIIHLKFQIAREMVSSPRDGFENLTRAPIDKGQGRAV